ncbi:MAG: hypothetical protein WC344_02265 [Bacilli bacterium]|jgi:hypothetical protein
MKKSKNEILKRLRQEGGLMTPDVLDNIYKAIGVEPTLIGEKEKVIEKRIRAEADLFVSQQKALVYATNEKPRLSLRALFQKPRFVTVMATAMAAVVIFVTLVTLGINGLLTIDTTGSTNTSSSPDTSHIVPTPIKNDQQVFSVGALTSNVLFEYVEPVDGGGEFRALLATSDSDVIVPKLSPYLEMVEQLISSNGEFEVYAEESDRPEFEIKETIVAYDALRVSMNYVMYYKVENLHEEGEESTYYFTGIIIYGDDASEYEIEGRRVMEEDEAKVTMQIRYSESDCIWSEYKRDGDDLKYRFQVYAENILVSDSKLKIVNTETKTKLTIDFESDNDSYNFKMEYADENPLLCTVDYNIKLDGENKPRKGTIDILIVVDEETGLSSYAMTIKPKDGQQEEHSETRGHGQGNGQGNNH